jgi:hypothetical protein
MDFTITTTTRWHLHCSSNLNNFLFFEKQATPSEKTIVILWDTVVGNQIDKNKIKCYCGIELLVRASSVVLDSWMLVRLREEREERLWDTDTWYIQEKRKDTRELFTNTKHLFFFILVFIFHNFSSISSRELQNTFSFFNVSEYFSNLKNWKICSY